MRRITEDAILAITAGAALVVWSLALLHPGRMLAFDFVTYRDAAASWLGGTGFYPAYELAGPFAVVDRQILYPPSALLLFVPFAVLPAVLWWAIPTAITAWFVVRARPSRLCWAAIFACLAVPWAPAIWLAGNAVIWIVAGLAAARHGWPVAVVLLKPQFAPLALIGVRSRSFWFAALALTALSLTMLPFWFEWFRVMANMRTAEPAYWLNNVPLLAVPLAAWLGSTRQGPRVRRWRTAAPARLLVAFLRSPRRLRLASPEGDDGRG